MELLVMRNPIQLYSRKTYQITFVGFYFCGVACPWDCGAETDRAALIVTLG